MSVKLLKRRAEMHSDPNSGRLPRPTPPNINRDAAETRAVRRLNNLYQRAQDLPRIEERLGTIFAAELSAREPSAWIALGAGGAQDLVERYLKLELGPKKAQRAARIVKDAAESLARHLVGRDGANSSQLEDVVRTYLEQAAPLALTVLSRDELTLTVQLAWLGGSHVGENH